MSQPLLFIVANCCFFIFLFPLLFLTALQVSNLKRHRALTKTKINSHRFFTFLACEWFLVSVRDKRASKIYAHARPSEDVSAENSCYYSCMQPRLMVNAKENDPAVCVARPHESHATRVFLPFSHFRRNEKLLAVYNFT